MIEVAWKEKVAAGTDIIKQGDFNGNYFYVVQDGTFEVFVEETSEGDGGVHSEEAALCQQEENSARTVTAGGSFGELALLYLAPRAATVRAKADSTVWVFDRGNFKSILMKASAKKLEEYMG